MSKLPENHLFDYEIPLDHTPVIKMLSSYIDKEAVSFHMPGHTGGRSFPKWLKENAFSIDTTELSITGDLMSPYGAVAESMRLAARAFGAAETLFITTGSTTAVHAALLSVASPGDEIIIFRNVHKSVMNACMLFDLNPLFATEGSLSSTIAEHPDAVAVLLTRPDYYGRCCDISTISDFVHKAGMVLIVDEAHGTHFAFCPSLFPIPSVSNGADLVIQSAHKTVPALTQGSYLHISNEALKHARVEALRVRKTVSMLTTSSSSFLIAATLDFARAFLSEYGETESKILNMRIMNFIDKLLPFWKKCLSRPDESDKNVTFDPFRLVFNMKETPFSVRDIVEDLAKNGIYIEFHDLQKMVLIVKFGNTKQDFNLLADVLNRFAEKHSVVIENFSLDFIRQKAKNTENIRDRQIQACMSLFPRRVLPPRCGIEKNISIRTIPLHMAQNQTLSTAIIPYPPGVPLVWPGEILDLDMIGLLLYLIENEMFVDGIEYVMNKESGVKIPCVCCFNL